MRTNFSSYFLKINEKDKVLLIIEKLEDSQQQRIKKRQFLKKLILVSFFDKIFLQSQINYTSQSISLTLSVPNAYSTLR